MSTHKVEVVKVGPAKKHENADSLEIRQVFGFPVISRIGEFSENSLACYVPVDSVMPNTEQWSFLGDNRRIRAKRLRGVFSMGMLVPAPDNTKEGDDASELLGIIKYEPPVPLTMGGEAEKDPGFIPRYTEIENFLRYGHKIAARSLVAIQEKVHGANLRAIHDGTRLWIGSHGQIKSPASNTIWWKAAKQIGLEDILAKVPGLLFYGEVFGAVQDLKYGAKPGELFVQFFDVLDTKTNMYFSWEESKQCIKDVGLTHAPTLYEGPIPDRAELDILASGKSTLADHIREGIVIRTQREQYDLECGRLILKLISPEYLLRKNGSEGK